MKFTRSPVIHGAVKRFFARYESLYAVIDKLKNPNIDEPELLLKYTISEFLGEVADGDSIRGNWEGGLEVGVELLGKLAIITPGQCRIWTSCNHHDGIYYWVGDDAAIAAKIDAIK